MIRNIDYIGRIVIPAEIRKSLDIKPNDELRIEKIKNTIIIQKNDEKKEIKNIKESLSIIEKISN